MSRIFFRTTERLDCINKHYYDRPHKLNNHRRESKLGNCAVTHCLIRSPSDKDLHELEGIHPKFCLFYSCFLFFFYYTSSKCRFSLPAQGTAGKPKHYVIKETHVSPLQAPGGGGRELITRAYSLPNDCFTSVGACVCVCASFLMGLRSHAEKHHNLLLMPL